MQKSKIKEEQCCQRTREEKRKGSHFFKIIHSSCIQDRRLAIPKKFIRNFGKELANVVVLKVPSNKHWEVELVEDEGQVCFQNGWHRFMEYHSIISVGHFLVFRYDGNSQFSVVILDTTASEIEYPCDVECEPSMLTKNSNHEQEHLACVRYNEGPRELMDCRDNYPLSSPPGMLRPRSDDLHHVTNNEGPVESSSSFLHIGVQSNIRKNTSILQVQDNAQAELVHGPRRLVLIKEKKQPDLVAARAFTSENPFCTVIMHSSYVSYPFLVNLPVGFARAYLKENVQCVTLRVSDGRRWQVQYSSVTYRFRLMKGWKDFVLDNDLEKDDICIFELVNWKRTEMKVAIFRVLKYPKQREISAQSKSSGCNPVFPTRNKGKQNEDGNIRSMGVQIRGRTIKSSITAADDSKQEPRRKLPSLILATDKERSVISARAFKSKNPFCAITMRRSYMHEKYNLNIPQDFANKYLKEAFQGVTLRLSNGGTWNARRCDADHRKLYSSGWKAFVLANHIKVDDVCIFELVDKKHIELKVTIFGACPLELAA